MSELILPVPEDVRGQRVIIGLTGGIACYKIASVVSALTQGGVDVTVAMTDAATKFITPLTFQALSGRPVYTSQWQHVEAHDPQHIQLARSAGAMLISPCSMDMLARLVNGHTDDVVSLIVSAVDRATTSVLLAPSMNAVMYNQPATQRNLKQLSADGFTILEPESGWQACRTEGVGRLPDPPRLVEAIVQALRPSEASDWHGSSAGS